MDDLDRLLILEETVSPSPRFAAGVMEAIAAASGEPPPIPFPWSRYAAGVLACVAWAGSSVWLFTVVDPSALDLALTQLAAVTTELGYAAAALLASFAALSFRRTLAYH